MKAWAVYDNKRFTCVIGRTSKQAKERYINEHIGECIFEQSYRRHWQRLQQSGYTCKKVTITKD